MFSRAGALALTSAFCLITVGRLSAQTTAAPATPAASSEANEEVIQLSPFVVQATDEGGYIAKDTLAGTRVRTELKDVASALSVVTKQFMENTGAKNSQDLLVYTTNTEVGGIHGNFSGAGGGQTYNESANLLRPSNNTRVRGLDAADNTRDYFLTEIPWDSYIVDRVDMQRGPNSILFGVGSPAGIINTSVNSASFKNANKVENRIGQYGSVRTSLDINRVLLKNELAVRFAALDDDSEYQQKPAYSHDRRLFGAIKYEPKLIENGRTSIKLNYENGNVRANRPRQLPPIDGITPWFLTGKDKYGYFNANKQTINPNIDWTRLTVDTSTITNNPAWPNGVAPWQAYAVMGRMNNPNISKSYNYIKPDGTTTTLVQESSPGTALGLNSTGAIDGTIGGMQFSSNQTVATYNAYARQVIPGGAFYGDKSLADSSIFDFYHNLMDGPNKSEYQKWSASNLALSQTFLDDRVGLEFVYDYQRYRDGQIGFLSGGSYTLGIDIRSQLLDGTDNSNNVGRPYVGNSGQYGNAENYINRDSMRLTAFGDLRSEDFLEKSLLTRILGHSVFTGLLSQDLKRTDTRGFVHWASEPGFLDYTGNPANQGYANITSGARSVDWIAYLGPTLKNASSASGANVSRITTTIAPAQYENLRFFDSHWNAPASVKPGDYYEYISYTNVNTDPTKGPTIWDTGVGGPVLNGGYNTNADGSQGSPKFTQSDNPANYVGWTTKSFKTLSSDNGDISSLYTSGQKAINKIKSQGITWQAYMFDDLFVPVFGWRKDTVTNSSSQAPKGAYDQSLMDYTVDQSAANTQKVSGQSRSYGFVLHTPKSLRDKLPFGTHFSLFANKSANFKADAPRGDIFGNLIPNPTGDTKDYGVVISTLDDKLTLKITKYKTKVQNATLSGDSAGFAGSLYYVWALPYWEATHALAALDGISTPQLRQGNWGWPWNGIATLADGSPDNARIGAIVKDFFTKFPLSQHTMDEYGTNMNVAKMHSTNIADWYAAVPKYGSGSIADGGQGAASLGLQPAYGGNLRDFGSGPVAAGDTTSQGMEYELTAQVTKQWSLSVNTSKTEASRTSISPSLDQWINAYTTFMAGDAGLIKLWGGDTFRKNWADNILAPYSVLKGQLGLTAPEIAKWRMNMVTNYNFSNGMLKGVNVGLAYRWEGKRILGYQYDPVKKILDVSKPWSGPTDDHFDMWAGYGRKLTDKIYWRVQVNLRNVGESNHLVPVSINPDGAVALSRIAEGMGWQLTNTFTF